jgi:hypothetical protein
MIHNVNLAGMVVKLTERNFMRKIERRAEKRDELRACFQSRVQQ